MQEKEYYHEIIRKLEFQVECIKSRDTGWLHFDFSHCFYVYNKQLYIEFIGN
jgi:hypothetical protein